MTGKLSKNFRGVGIGPLSKIYAVKPFLWHYNARLWVIVGCYHSLEKKSLTYLFAWIDVKYQVAYKFEIWLDKLKRNNFITKKERKVKGYFFLYCSFFCLTGLSKIDMRLMLVLLLMNMEFMILTNEATSK